MRFLTSELGAAVEAGDLFASDDARPFDHFAHETPSPPVGQVTRLKAD